MSSKPSKNLSGQPETATRNLAQFQEKVQTYRRLSGNSQKELAEALGLHPKVLGRKLSLANNAVLTLPEIKQIVKTLAQWRAILTQPEAFELLALMGLPATIISDEEWQSLPLSRLEPAGEVDDRERPNNESKEVTKEKGDVRHNADFTGAQPERQHNLPVFPTSLIGREQSATHVCSLLQRSDVQVVTLIGPGGIGKTRLSVQIASTLVAHFKHGVWFVSLAPLRDPALVLPTIAETLGLRTESNVPIEEVLAGYLRNKQMLLVLDNFEQVIDAAPALGRSLTSAAGLKLLITSRIALRLYGEHEYSVPLLPLPDLNASPAAGDLADNPAIRLFVQRAQAVKADFELTAQNAIAVARICTRMDGLPLAIELAATRIRLFTPETLLARLDSRLSMLTGGPRDLPERQKTVRATIQWSYDLLDETEKTLFAYLSIFAGGATLPAVEAVCSDDAISAVTLLDGLESLMTKSLLNRRDDPGGEARFYMLETIREFAQERLAERAEHASIQQRHANFYVALAERIAPRLATAQLTESLELLSRELDNLRSACAWSVAQDVAEAALRIAGCLQLFWYWRGYVEEGRRWLEAGLARSQGAPDRVCAKAYRSAGLLAWAHGDYAQALVYDNQSLELYRALDDKRGMAEALNSLGNSSSEVGDDDTARQFYEQSLTFYRASGYVPGIGMVLSNLGEVAARNGDYAAARNYYDESLALKRTLGNPGSIALVLLNLGEVAIAQGDDEQAVGYLEEGLRLSRKVNTPHIIGLCLENLAKVAVRRGAIDAAMKLLREALSLLRDIHNTRALLYALEVTAGAFGFGGQTDIAVRLFGAAAALRGTLQVPLPPGDRPMYEWLRSGVEVAHETQMWVTEWTMGQALTLEETLDFALTGMNTRS